MSNVAMKPCPTCGSLLASKLAEAIANPNEEESCPKKGTRFEISTEPKKVPFFNPDAWDAFIQSMMGFSDLVMGSLRSQNNQDLEAKKFADKVDAR